MDFIYDIFQLKKYTTVNLLLQGEIPVIFSHLDLLCFLSPAVTTPCNHAHGVFCYITALIFLKKKNAYIFIYNPHCALVWLNESRVFLFVFFKGKLQIHVFTVLFWSLFLLSGGFYLLGLVWRWAVVVYFVCSVHSGRLCSHLSFLTHPQAWSCVRIFVHFKKTVTSTFINGLIRAIFLWINALWLSMSVSGESCVQICPQAKK